MLPSIPVVLLRMFSSCFEEFAQHSKLAPLSSLISLGAYAFEPAPRANWIASTNIEYGSSNHYPIKAIDGFNNSFFHSAEQGLDEAGLRSNWLQIYFGEELSVNKVQLLFRQDLLVQTRRAFLEAII